METFAIVVDNRADRAAPPIFTATVQASRLTVESLASSVWNALCGHSSGRGWRLRVYADEDRRPCLTIDDGPWR